LTPIISALAKQKGLKTFFHGYFFSPFFTIIASKTAILLLNQQTNSPELHKIKRNLKKKLCYFIIPFFTILLNS
jgi:hypothetical protein